MTKDAIPAEVPADFAPLVRVHTKTDLQTPASRLQVSNAMRVSAETGDERVDSLVENSLQFIRFHLDLLDGAQRGVENSLLVGSCLKYIDRSSM